MNWNSLGVTGCGVPDVSPQIDQLAGEGVRFENALNNLIDSPEHRTVLNELRQRLRDMMASTADPLTDTFRAFLSQREK